MDGKELDHNIGWADYSNTDDTKETTFLCQGEGVLESMETSDLCSHTDAEAIFLSN